MFLYSRWCDLDISIRNKIANNFNIQKKNSTHVVDNVIQNDGYVVKDIEEALNIDAIQKYVGRSETDMAVLWDLLIAKIEGNTISTYVEVLEKANESPEFKEEYKKEVAKIKVKSKKNK